MNRAKAKELSETITNAQIKEMLEKAKIYIKDWTRVSDVNKGLTKGAAWNMFAKDFDENIDYPSCTKLNIIREFGNFLPSDLLYPRKDKKFHQPTPPVHQEPIF